MIDVLDHGYVKLVDQMGSELSIVNAARVSFSSESSSMSRRDIRLIQYLSKHGHMSPFRHVVFSFEVKAPLMVARQWMKYRVGSDHGPDTAELLGIAVPEELQDSFYELLRQLEWMPAGDDEGFGDRFYARNEVSRRYVTLEPEWYIPASNRWRSAPESKKQGSGDPLTEDTGKVLTELLQQGLRDGMLRYDEAMRLGVAPEQARGFLPSMYFLYTSWRWTASLQAVMHFIDQRLVQDGAQSEIREYARAVYDEVHSAFPNAFEALTTTV